MVTEQEQICGNIKMVYFPHPVHDWNVFTDDQEICPVLCVIRFYPFIDYLRCEAFLLTQVHPERHYFVKLPMKLDVVQNYESETYRVDFNGYGDPVFKSIPSLYFAQVYKSYFKIPIAPEDLVFLHEGLVARFEKSIYGE